MSNHELTQWNLTSQNKPFESAARADFPATPEGGCASVGPHPNFVSGLQVGEVDVTPLSTSRASTLVNRSVWLDVESPDWSCSARSPCGGRSRWSQFA